VTGNRGKKKKKLAQDETISVSQALEKVETPPKDVQRE
jgi:hypothetical protein